MRVLVTRPAPDAEKTAARLRRLGHEPVIAPLLEIVFNPPPADTPEPAAIVLTSRNAVKALSRWPKVSGWLDRPVFVTGHGTGEAAGHAGFSDVRSADGAAADLAALVISEIEPQARPILYPAARDRSEGFLESLRTRGYDICVVEAYRAEMAAAFAPAVAEELRYGRIDAVLLYSRRTAEAFRRATERAGLEGAVASTRICALSVRVAEPVGDLGTEVAIAVSPDEDSLLELLQARTG